MAECQVDSKLRAGSSRRAARTGSAAAAILATSLAGCGLFQPSGPGQPGSQQPRPDITPVQVAAKRVPLDKELDRMKKTAQAVAVNDAGYEEAKLNGVADMILVPGGSFTMGNNSLTADVAGEAAAPAHKVTLSPYWIAKTPVTIGQFRQFVDETQYQTSVELSGHQGSYVYNFQDKGFRPTPGHKWDNSFFQVTEKYPKIVVTAEHPVVNVSWFDCLAYTNWLSKKYKLPFTLPTEAEWERAARGTDGRIYPWGNEDPDGTRANYADDTFNKYFPETGQSDVHHGINDGHAITSPVGSYPAGRSPIGALDMAGNVTEWVYDGPSDYTDTPKTDPLHGADSQDVRMQKAGFWAGSAGRPDQSPNELINGHNIRADARQGDDPGSADDHLGCRAAISYTVRSLPG